MAHTNAQRFRLDKPKGKIETATNNAIVIASIRNPVALWYLSGASSKGTATMPAPPTIIHKHLAAILTLRGIGSLVVVDMDLISDGILGKR
jgi:hypothetical protein